MALRSRTRIASAGSGPGRGPDSDGRLRHRRARRRPTAPAEDLRRRAELLFGERDMSPEELDHGPPERERRTAAAVSTATATGPAPGLIAARTADTTAPTAPRARDLEPAGGMHRLEPSKPLEPSEPLESSASLVPPGPGAIGWRERLGPALRERMPVWLQTRCGVERRGVVALAVVLVAAAVFAVQHFWAGRTESVRAPQVVRAEAPYAKKGEDVKTGAGVRSTASPGGEIVVDVSGKVQAPGIRRLPAGSRVADALRAAGGVRPGVNTEGLNRARFLVDGEQVLVGAPVGAVAPPGPAGEAASGPAGAGPAAPVSLNTATVDQLDSLPGVGPVLARHIIDYRTQHGGFRSVDELREVNGIGGRRFSDLRDLVRT
ncbi:ComEA family DNA-binding protein [Streptomyces sp. FXJ1.172]|uniref:ComEA family DNA-binding protein n=1 Tax=Streptomyces sp. FXJ1.172 TaxID=710705 RepID=UPI000D1844C3|nr:ComEA family DNA-binding protein [Streptomyces sp. FXJ1.172]WEO97493.1 ComEA family DNA-binding protein [Streptomyces sp. FXJ1.172]